MVKFRVYRNWLAFLLLLLIAVLILQVVVSSSVDRLAPVAPLTRKTLNKSIQEGQDGSQVLYPGPEAVPSGKTQPVSTIFISMNPEILRVFRHIKSGGAEIKRWQNITIAFAPSQSRENAKMKLHGWTSLAAPKKSYAIKLSQPAEVAEDLGLKRFFLLNMADDAGMFQGYFSYLYLADLGLFPNFFQYVAVEVNEGETEIYLLVERTGDALLRLASPVEFIARRRVNDAYETKYSRTGGDDPVLMRFIETGRMQGGPEKRASYKQTVDLEMYMSWLIFNALVGYPDSLDELFFYRKGSDAENFGTSLLKIAAWDYDSLFSPPAHPENVVASPLFSAVECDLGHFISRDENFLAGYRKQMKAMLEQEFSEEHIRQKLLQVKKDRDRISHLLPFKRKEKFISDGLEKIKLFEQKIMLQRKMLLEILEKE